MALTLKDRVLETTTSTGIGSIALGGTTTGYQAFSVVGDGNTTYYTIQSIDSSGNPTGEWEVGTGTYTAAGNTLSRDSVFDSSNGGAKVVFSSGTKQVFCDLPAEAVSTGGGGANFPVNTNITSMTGITGGISTPQFIQMDNGNTQTLVAGKMWYTPNTGAWNLGMGNGNITQQVGEELFIYGKASAAITDSPLQIIYHTGTVGASGTPTFAPTIAGLTDVNAILGVATESIALNGFGRITTYGIIHGINTSGSAYGETWADDDPIWYNPVTGNPTKVKPTAPNMKIQVGIVVSAGSGGSGSFQVSLRQGTVLGGTDSNVQLTSPANGNILTYDTSNSYWKNTALAAGTGISVSAATGGAITVTNSAPDQTVALTAGTGISTSGTYPNFTVTNTAPDQVVSLTGAGTTTITGTYPSFTITSTGGSGGGDVTGPASAVNNNFASYNGTTGKIIKDSGFSSSSFAPATSGTSILYGNGSGGFSNVTIGSGLSFAAGTLSATGGGGSGTVTSVDMSVPSFLSVTGNPITTSGTLAVTYSGTALPIANGGTGQTSQTAAFDALSPATTKGDLIVYNGTDNVRQAIGTDTFVLTADSTQATGLKWSAANAGTVTSVSGTGTVNGLTLTGTVTSTGNLTLGGTLDLSSPPTIGNTTANTGRFTTLAATGVFTASAGTSSLPSIVTSSGSTTGLYSSTANVLGVAVSATSIGTFTSTGLNGMAVGATTASTGAFTSLSASGTVSGTGFTNRFSSPGAIGNTTASSGAFTTLAASTSILLTSTSGGVGYATGSGGAITQLTSRTTGVTLNRPTGAITLFAAAGSTTATTFTVTNSTVAANDVIMLSQKSGTNLYVLSVTAVAAGSFNLTFYTTGGTASDSPVFQYAIIKGAIA